MKLLPQSLLAALFFLCGNNAFAQSDTLAAVTINPYIISDSLSQIGVAKIGVDQLSSNNLVEIPQIINRVPGVLMQSSNFTTNRIIIRGIGARTPYGTNKIRAYYQNIPLTSGDGETVIDDIDLQNIGAIEIIKGPKSSIYGAGLGGAILISPKTGMNEASYSLVHGSFGLTKNSANVSWSNNKSNFNVNLHNLESDGWRYNSSYKRQGATISGNQKWKRTKISYLANYTWLKGFIPSSIDEKTFVENPRAASKTWADARGYKEYRSILGGVTIDNNLARNINLSTTLFGNYKKSNEPRPFDILRQYTFSYGVRSQLKSDFSLFKRNLKTNIGVEIFTEDYHGKNLENNYKTNNGQGSLEGFQLTGANQKRLLQNVFAQVEYDIYKNISLQGGLNINSSQFKLNNSFPVESSFKSNLHYATNYSPNVSLTYSVRNRANFYASYARGFSLPSVSESLNIDGTFNQDLKPERGANYELGGKFNFLKNNLHIKLAAFDMKVSNLLVAKRIAEDQYVGTNAGKTRHRGLELSSDFTFSIAKYFTVYTNVNGTIGEYRFLDFIDRDKDFSGNRLTGVPSKQASALFKILMKNGIYVSADALWVDKLPLNDSNSKYSNAYQILNAKAGAEFSLFQKLSADISFGINNFANEKYASLILPNAVGFGKSEPRYFYPGLPVNYYGSFTLKYSI